MIREKGIELKESETVNFYIERWVWYMERWVWYMERWVWYMERWVSH